MGLMQQLGFAPLSGGYSSVPMGGAEIPGTLANLSLPSNIPIAGIPPALPSTNADPARKFSPEQESVLKLLADGFLPVTVASTLGISESAVSQHLSSDSFKAELAARKQKTLGRYKAMDDSYDRLEGKLLEKLEGSIMFFARPGEIVSALEKVNKMRRRVGASDGSQANAPISQIVNISMPVAIIHKFITTKEGHVVGLDNKSLLTIQSQTLNGLVKEYIQNKQDDSLTLISQEN